MDSVTAHHKLLKRATNRISLLTLAATATTALLAGLSAPVLADGDLKSNFPLGGGIINSRHNLTQSTLASGGAGPGAMAAYRNDYGEVCVYCHTPHGANLQLQAPLWNRTNVTQSGYVTYNTLGTSSLTGTVTAPGPASLTCLSCHDGTVAVDSIINMPGSFQDSYDPNQVTSQTESFLDGWSSPYGTSTAGSHFGLNDSSTGCLACHAAGAPLGSGATDLTVQALGIDFRDDHPIGIPFKSGDPNFNDMTATKGNISYYDNNSNSHPDSNEIRAYNSGDGFEVECASCHDPHGVEQAGVRFPTFLRVKNDGSAVCLTCHVK